MQLPVTALPLTAKVEYSQRWKNLRLPIIAIHVRGRLGNVMGEYASMFAIQKVYGIQVVQTPECNKELEQAFHHLSIPVLELGENNTIIYYHETHFLKLAHRHRNLVMMSMIGHTSALNPIFITLYLHPPGVVPLQKLLRHILKLWSLPEVLTKLGK